MTRVALVLVSLWVGVVAAQSDPSDIFNGDGYRYRAGRSDSIPVAPPQAVPSTRSSGSAPTWQGGDFGTEMGGSGTLAPVGGQNAWRWRGDRPPDSRAYDPQPLGAASPWGTNASGYPSDQAVVPRPMFYRGSSASSPDAGGADTQDYRFRGDPGSSTSLRTIDAPGNDAYRFRPLDGVERKRSPGNESLRNSPGNEAGSDRSDPESLFDSMRGRTAPPSAYPPSRWNGAAEAVPK